MADKAEEFREDNRGELPQGVKMRPMFQFLTGYIYFIQQGGDGPVKIGFTKDVENRMKNLQTANPKPLDLLVFYPGNEEMEKELHYRFDSIRVFGEWFEPYEKLFREVREQQRINEKHGFIKADPGRDLGDQRLASRGLDN